VYLVRHGQSIWNHDSKFTGWTDIPLTKKGEEEAATIAQTLMKEKIYPDVFFSSVLDRAIQTSNIMKKTIKNERDMKITTYTSWRLNEKHYGSLEGIPRQYMRKEYGDKFTQMMRNNFYMKPPVITDLPNKSEIYPVYQNCYFDKMKNGESKENILERLLPYFQNDVLYVLRQDKIPIIVTHKHCGRVLMKYFLKMSDEEFEDFTIPSHTILEMVFNNDYSLKYHRYISYS
tara:strand:+ start:35086 stop:35778 length:693 start_codon:yes stop_codon:yes gene_type:complete